MGKNIESTNDENTDKKLIISDVMDSILHEMLTEVYEQGNNDGYNTFFNRECVGEDKRREQFVEGREKCILRLLKKYCS
jgi:hypothetical protein